MKTVNSGQMNDLGRVREGSASNTHITKDTPLSSKGMNDLSQGDKFKATVIDIQPNKVTIRLGDGNTLTAKSLVLPEARIGEESIFVVKENIKGQILLEMFKSEGQLPTNFIKEALSNAGLYGTEENIELTGHMLKNDMPVDASTLQKAAYFRHVSGNAEMDSVLFMLKEEFEASPITVRTLNDIMDKTIGLSKNLGNVLDMVFADDVFEVLGKETAMTMLGASDNEEQKTELSKEALKKQLEQKLFIDLKDSSEKSLNDYYKDVYKASLRAKEILDNAIESGRNTGEAARALSNELSHVLENIEFSNHISNYKEYMQLPFIFNGTKNQGELYVFKDKKGKKSYGEQASILIAMDYASLGHVEIFINKSKNNLNFQFKGNDATLKIIGRETKKLSGVLSGKGFTVSGISFKTLDEQFNVTMDSAEKKEKEVRRFSFDMRV